MKALLTTLFFLTLMAGMVARWSDGLLDQILLPRAVKSGLEERRRRWGREQGALHRALNPHLTETAETAALPLGILFERTAADADPQLEWMQALLARLCQACHPDLRGNDKEALLLIRLISQQLADSRIAGKVPHRDRWSEFSGKITCNADLLALPLAEPMRSLWQQICVGAPPAEASLLEMIDITAYEPVRLESLPLVIAEAMVGTQGASTLLKMRPDLRESALSQWLDPNGLAASQRIIDWSSTLQPWAGEPVAHSPISPP